nr:hypothetical protein [Tanacetum cinerariifolium]
MTIAEYMEYEVEMKRINVYYDLPLLLPCFKPVQPHTEDRDISGALPCQLPPKELNSGSFTLPCSIGEPNETMTLARPFLATIHAQIDVFKREISLGFGEDRVSFDMDGNELGRRGMPWMMWEENAKSSMRAHHTHDTMRDSKKKNDKKVGGRSFICITKQLDDALPLGRVNESRFIGMIRKEMDEEGGTIRKT